MDRSRTSHGFVLFTAAALVIGLCACGGGVGSTVSSGPLPPVTASPTALVTPSTAPTATVTPTAQPTSAPTSTPTALPTATPAPTPTPSISGFVHSDSGAALSGASVKSMGDGSSLALSSATTDSAGSFVVSAAGPGLSTDVAITDSTVSPATLNLLAAPGSLGTISLTNVSSVEQSCYASARTQFPNAQIDSYAMLAARALAANTSMTASQTAAYYDSLPHAHPQSLSQAYTTSTCDYLLAHSIVVGSAQSVKWIGITSVTVGSTTTSAAVWF